MGRGAVETILGFLVIGVAVVFVFFAYDTAQVKAVKGYTVTADFYRAGGLTAGSDVRISGIKVGTVTGSRLNHDTFDAVITMSIAADVRLPEDTAAVIGSEGILGGRYVRLEPGGSETMIEPGGAVTKTKDFRSLEDQVGEIIFLATGGGPAGN
ncbi:MAG: outer membrane lipid asymmetry maintenance protein MlaD [Rhodospirillales bacterium]